MEIRKYLQVKYFLSQNIEKKYFSPRMLKTIFSYTEFYADHFNCQVQFTKIIP